MVRENLDSTKPSASSNRDVKVDETTEAAPEKEDREYRKGMSTICIVTGVYCLPIVWVADIQ